MSCLWEKLRFPSARPESSGFLEPKFFGVCHNSKRLYISTLLLSILLFYPSTFISFLIELWETILLQRKSIFLWFGGIRVSVLSFKESKFFYSLFQLQDATLFYPRSSHLSYLKHLGCLWTVPWIIFTRKATLTFQKLCNYFCLSCKVFLNLNCFLWFV